ARCILPRRWQTTCAHGARWSAACPSRRSLPDMSFSPFSTDPMERRALRDDASWSNALYELPSLPYPKDALDGFLSAEILELHHGQHHRKYVDGLNEPLHELTDARRREDFARIQDLNRRLAFHGSGHVLHSLYWDSLSPEGGGEPGGALKSALEAC